MFTHHCILQRAGTLQKPLNLRTHLTLQTHFVIFEIFYKVILNIKSSYGKRKVLFFFLIPDF